MKIINSKQIQFTRENKLINYLYWRTKYMENNKRKTI